MVRIPKFFHEILGEYQRKSALLVIALFVLISGTTAGTLGFNDWNHLSFIKQLVMWLLFVDIAGGVVANITKGTDMFYHRHPEKRWIFIAIHIQPVILAWSMEFPLIYGVLLSIYTLLFAALLNVWRDAELQPLFAAGFTGVGLLFTAYFGQTIPFLAAVVLSFYVFKVLYSFSVFHHRKEYFHEM